MKNYNDGHQHGFELDCDPSELSEKDLHRFDACVSLVHYGKTLRQIEEDTGIPRSTLDQWVHQKLRSISYKLYKCVLKRFKINLEGRYKRR